MKFTQDAGRPLHLSPTERNAANSSNSAETLTPDCSPCHVALRSSMMETRQLVDAPTWARFARLMLKALPVRSPKATLETLARVWQELTSAEVVFVWAPPANSKGLLGCRSEAGRPVEFSEFGQMNSQPFEVVEQETTEQETTYQETGEDVFAALQRRDDFAEVASLRPVIIPFLFDNRSVGGVILFFLPLQTLECPLRPEIDEWSGRLIAQAQQHKEQEARSEDELEARKLESLAEFAAGAGHEINNPLATISGRAQLLLQDETDPQRRAALLTIGGQAYRIRDMIGDLMLLARPPRPNLETLNVADVIDHVLASLNSEAVDGGCSFTVHADQSLVVRADRVQLSVVLSGLIRNSLDALENGGPIVIRAHSIRFASDQHVLLSVSDRGPGLSETDRRHLFDPFYSGRQAGRGLGFGLSKCRRIVTGHGGWMEVDSVPNGETTFRIYLPVDGGVCNVDADR